MPAIQNDEELQEGAFYIFNGVVTNYAGIPVENLVVKAENAQLHMIEAGKSYCIAYDSTTKQIKLTKVNIAGIRSKLAAQAPFVTWGGSLSIDVLPSTEQVVGKIIPTEEVSDLNFLNSYEDELTDI